MLNDTDVVEAFGHRLSPAACASLLGRLLRVPTIWNAMHDPDTLARILATEAIEDVRPVDILTACVRLRRLADDQLHSILAGETEPLTDAEALERLSTLSQTIVWSSQHDLGSPWSEYLRDDDSWAEALACAWPDMVDPTACLGLAFTGRNAPFLKAAVNALLANESREDADGRLRAALGDDITPAITALHQIGEDGLAASLADLETRDDRSPKDLTRSIATASPAQLPGRLEEGHRALQQAWDLAQEATADIADRLAEFAEAQQELVLSLEARQRALGASATPRRRAALAWCQATLDKADQALHMLADNPESFEESIARSAALLGRGDREGAIRLLADLPAGPTRLRDLPWVWLERAEQLAASAGNFRLAGAVSAEMARRAPASASTWVQRAKFFSASGQDAHAVQAATVALGLAPGLPEAQQVLAAGLVATGKPQQALPILNALAEADPRYLPDLAECALQAGDPDCARQLADRILASGDQPLKAHILLARAAGASGHPETARRQLHALVSAHPDQPQAWIALADMQAAAGEESLAGATLASGVQAVPGEPHLLMAYANWLRARDRTTEAAAHAVTAVGSHPAPGNWLRQAGTWLRELGRPEESLLLLQRAAEMLPNDAAVRMELAALCEQTGQASEAYRHLRDLPVEAPGVDHLLAGRVGIAYAEQTGDSGSVAWAAKHLAAALDHPPVEPEAHYWFARSQMLAGNAIAAAQHYLAAVAKLAGTDSPTHLKAALALADAALEADQPALALDPLNDLRATHPASMQLHLQLARLFAACEMWDKAMPLAEQAASLAPANPEVYRQLGSIAVAAGADNAALQAYQRLVELEPAEFEGWLSLANSSAKLEHTGLQRAAVAHALVLSRDDPGLLLRLSGVLAVLKEASLAELALRRAHRLAPLETAPLLALAEIAGLTGDREQARIAWTALSDLEPSNLEFVLAAGEAEHTCGHLAAATELYRRAVKAAPTDPRTHLALARELGLSGDLPAAAAAYREALTAFPANPQVLVAAGQAFLARGRIADAQPVLELALECTPEDPQARLSLADCLLRSGQPGKVLALLDSESSDSLPVVAHACLRVLAHAQLGETEKAGFAFAQATLPQDPSPADRWWISRAAREVGGWEHVLRPDLLAPSPSEDTQLEALDGLVRLADAAWLFTFVGAAAHAPSASWLDIQAWDRWTQLEESLSQLPAYSSQLSTLKPRADLYRLANDEGRRAALRQSLAQSLDILSAQTLGIACLRAGLPAEALDALRLVSPTGSGWTDLLQGMAHAGQGAPALALDCYHAAAFSAALRPLVAMLRGRTFLQLGQEEAAISEFNQALAAWPQEAAWHFELGSTYGDSADRQRALPHFQQAVTLAPERQDYHLAYARALAEAGQPASAVHEYEPVLESLPRVGGIWKEAGAAALEAQSFSLAQAWFDQACGLLPEDPHVWVGAALASHGKGNAKRASELIQAAYRLSPDDARVLMAVGDIYAAVGKHDKALQAYEGAAAKLVEPLPAHLGRLAVMIRIGKYAEAILQIERLQNEYPEDERLWLALSDAREGSGDLAGALAASERAVDLAPRAAQARVALGRLARKLGQLDRAIDVLSTFAPSGAEAAVELGLAYEARREFGRALEQFHRAIALDPGSASAHFHAGAVLRSIKDYPKASRMFERAVELDPQDADTLHQLAAVRALELVHGAIPLQAVL
ncbi:MAG: tetratricopeptide repeat protein [Anaerolineales bacterium]|nr:tetratricopeptide repeat protein [Anaerolineales bacterium]